MPTYVYDCAWSQCAQHNQTFERNVSIAARDSQTCRNCGTRLQRKVAFTGLTWAPTAGGMR